MDKLSVEELQAVVERHPSWSVQDGKIQRAYTFGDFVQAMEFVNHVAAEAEAAGHHPDIDIRYNKVTLGLITHDADGVTARDAEMVSALDEKFGR